jgi:hypothetical protein
LAVSLEKAIKIVTDPNLRANGESAYSILGEFVLKEIDSIPLAPTIHSEGLESDSLLSDINESILFTYVSNKLQIPYLSISPGPLDLLQGVEGILCESYDIPSCSI